MAKVAFIGLGVMGYPMAGHLKTSGGHDLTVYNRTAAKAEKWAAEFGGRAAATPAEAADGQDFVFSCVGNDDDLRSVTIGKDGAFETMRKGAIFIDNTTASAEVARELDAAATAGGFHFIDAPVSGGQAGAENGVLTVMCGGDPGVFEARQTRHRRLCPHGRPDGSRRLRPADQDGQPDLHRRPRPGARRRHPFRQEGRPRHREGHRGHLQGCRRLLADGEPPQDHDMPANTTSASPSTGCARTSTSCSPKPAPTAPSCRSPPLSISSMPTCRGWAAIAGTRPRCWRGWKNDAVAVLPGRCGDRPSEVAAEGGKPCRDGAFRHRNRDGARHLQCRPAARSRGKSSAIMVARSPYGTAASARRGCLRASPAEPKKLTAQDGQAMGRRFQLLGNRRWGRRSLCRRPAGEARLSRNLPPTSANLSDDRPSQ